MVPGGTTAAEPLAPSATGIKSSRPRAAAARAAWRVVIMVKLPLESTKTVAENVFSGWLAWSLAQPLENFNVEAALASHTSRQGRDGSCAEAPLHCGESLAGSSNGR